MIPKQKELEEWKEEEASQIKELEQIRLEKSITGTAAELPPGKSRTVCMSETDSIS